MEEQNHVQHKSKVKKLFSNYWAISTFVLALLLIVVLVTGFGFTGNASKDTVGDNVVNFLNSQVGGGVELSSVGENYGFYEVKVQFQGQEIPVYATKNGKYLVQGLSPLTGNTVSNTDTPTNTPNDTPTEVPKSDKPKVELFVMTYCPYGTQAEKGIIPVLKLLGNKINADIRFVHYFMHGDKEEAETYTQVCIREEQSSKYLDYLTCFLEASDSASCLTKTGIDKTKLDSCVKSKSEGFYKSDSDLSQGYGVQGSPTLVINGVESSSARSPSAYLDAICSAFTDESRPSECSQTLSSASPSPGFGSGTASNSASAASCG